MFCTPWWTDNPGPALSEALTASTSSVRSFYGIDDSYTSNSQMCTWLSAYQPHAASHVFQIINGYGQTPIISANILGITSIHSVPPLTPNCFSDGSFTHPTLPIFGLSTAAIWWPSRVDAFSDQELEFALCKNISS
eukprot:1882287-Karenia_brevis.AAC.1